MDLSTVDLNLLVAFDALMTERHVTRAGLRLGRTQSAMSSTLARLRELFDDPVLVRTGGHMAPTARALELIGPVRAALETVERCLSTDAEFDPATAEGAITIVVSDYAGFVLLPELSAQLESAAPGLEIRSRVTHSHQASEAFSSPADAAIGYFRNPGAEFDLEWLATEPFMTIAQPGVMEEPWDLDAYLRARHVLVSARGQQDGALDKMIAEHRNERRNKVVVPDWLTGARIIARTERVLTGPRVVVGHLAATHGFELRPVPEQLKRTASLSIVTPRRNIDRSRQAWIRGQLIAAVTAACGS